MSEGVTEAEQELAAMMDDGIHVQVTDAGQGVYRLHVSVDDEGCAECLVPDETLGAIASDTLRRHGVTVSTVGVEHLGVGTS